MATLAIDQGTSGTKALVVEDDGSVVSVAARTLRPDYRAGGVVEQDPQELLQSVLEAGREAAHGHRIDVVSLANQGETVLAWDQESGRPLSPAIVWQDSRAQSVCDRLVDSRVEVAERTGLVLDPYFSAPKMAWLRENITRRGVVTTTDTWLLHALTGAFVTDVTTASRSLLMDVDQRCWDSALLRTFGLADEVLPRIVDCDDMVGVTTMLGDPVPVAGVIVDQQAALLAE
jgi:glycerol kinase